MSQRKLHNKAACEHFTSGFVFSLNCFCALFVRHCHKTVLNKTERNEKTTTRFSFYWEFRAAAFYETLGFFLDVSSSELSDTLLGNSIISSLFGLQRRLLQWGVNIYLSFQYRRDLTALVLAWCSLPHKVRAWLMCVADCRIFGALVRFALGTWRTASSVSLGSSSRHSIAWRPNRRRSIECLTAARSRSSPLWADLTAHNSYR